MACMVRSFLILCYSTNYVLILGHEVVQLRLIFRPITNSLPNFFFAYVQHFTILLVDQDAGMHVLK